MARNMRCSDTGKDIYFTAKSADRAAVKIGARADRELFKYRCRLCKHWHLTHQRRQAVIREGISA